MHLCNAAVYLAELVQAFRASRKFDVDVVCKCTV
jgi:hypothetical protein